MIVISGLGFLRMWRIWRKDLKPDFCQICSGISRMRFREAYSQQDEHQVAWTLKHQCKAAKKVVQAMKIYVKVFQMANRTTSSPTHCWRVPLSGCHLRESEETLHSNEVPTVWKKNTCSTRESRGTCRLGSEFQALFTKECRKSKSMLIRWGGGTPRCPLLIGDMEPQRVLTIPLQSGDT